MDTNLASPKPNSSPGFPPLPSGHPEPRVTPERIREQLGWGLLQANWR